MRLLSVVLFICACTPTLSQPRGEEHLDAMARARRHYTHGRMVEAAAAYGEAAEHAERRVDRDEALYRQAKAYERAGEPRRALPILDEVARRRPVSRRTARALFDASKLRIELGDREAGLEGMRRLAREHPDHGLASRALFLVLDDHRRRDDTEGALAFLSRLEAEVSGSSLADDVLAHRADLLLARGDRAGAKETLVRLVEEHPYPHGQRWDDALVQLADLAQEEGDHAGAIGWLERLVAQHEETASPGSYTLPTMPLAQLRIARIYRDELGDRAAAARAFQAAYDRYPTATTRDDALVEHGEMLLDAGERERGCALLRKASEEFEVGRARRRAVERISRDCGGA